MSMLEDRPKAGVLTVDGSSARFVFTLTQDELREATQPRQPQRSLVSQAVIWFLLSTVGIVLAFPRYSLVTFAYVGKAAPQPAVQNLWSALIPSGAAATYFATAYLIGPAKRRRAARSSQPGQRREKIHVEDLVMQLWMLWLVPVLAPGFAIDWNPTDRQILWAASAVWSLYFCLITCVVAYRRRQATAATWNATPSLQRESWMEVTGNGVSTGNAVAETRYQWSCFKRYAETRSLLLLVTESANLLMLPKRALVTEDLLLNIKMLIYANIPDGEFATPLRGFPVTPSPTQH